MPDVKTRYTFHPVGQGLFASGEVAFEGGRPFHWVYDCGTLSDQALLSDQIFVLGQEYNTTGKIDLLVLSHFDRDHINGVVDLLGQFEVDVLLLPYMHLDKRLILAFEDDEDSLSPLMEFYVNPVSFLTRRGRIKQIVFVPASGFDSTSEPGDPISPRQRNTEDSDLSFRSILVFSEQEKSDFNAFNTVAKGATVSLMARGATMRLKGRWEFVPYNDAHFFPMAPGPFSKVVEAERKTLLAATNPRGREASLNRIKTEYDAQCGKGGYRRNAISLFVFAGPLGGRAGNCVCGSCSTVESFIVHSMRQVESLNCTCGCYGILYTGDGDLKDKKKFENMRTYFGGKRLSAVRSLQVMHHGSRNATHDGLAGKLRPCVSVFSSDPLNGRFKHPHAEVVKEFLPYGPVQVDTEYGYSMYLSF